MMNFLTGAVLFKNDKGLYCVEYQQHQIAECQYRDEAIMLALDRVRLQARLHEQQPQNIPIFN